MEYVPLSSGKKIPKIGLGTWQLTGDTCRHAVSEALSMGYEHIDTAFAYGNHAEVGAGIKDSGKSRDSFFLTTKVPLEKQKRDQVIQHGGQMLKELQVDYVDLLLLHWPNKEVPFDETLSAMAELVSKGYTRSIGISNFNKNIAEECVEISSEPIVTNQVEFHPYLYQRELLEACEQLDMRITAYSPLARGEVFGDERLRRTAEKHGTGISQVVISWLMEKGIIVIPKASSKEHLTSNLEALNVTLDPDDIAEIDAFPEERRYVDGGWKHYPF